MITLAIAVLALLALGVLTHLVPDTMKGRVGYPTNLTSRGAGRREDRPATRPAFEFTFTPQPERQLVACDDVARGA